MYDRDELGSILEGIKTDFESAIRDPDENPSYSLIRSEKLIGRIHSYIIDQLVDNGVNPQYIHEDSHPSDTSATVYGFPKTKSQDILVHSYEEDGPVVGPRMAINVRSQLSSIGKNFDTIFERIYAESLNLHNRFPYLPLGYFFLLPKRGYDSSAKQKNIVERSENFDIQKFISSYSSLSGRETPEDEKWKYEAMCLLIVDFEQSPPRIMDDIDEFVEQGLVTPEFAEIYGSNVISVENFFEKLLSDYKRRYSQIHDFDKKADTDDSKSSITDF
ncbi:MULTISPECIES: hypothetical protein [unclassified Haloferax]|uniref:Uncharacterized protein n=2 Tax=Haloferacaceae TaxID=1644056 RepID=A0ACD5HV14_9EURY|nr:MULTISPECIES: hypothetical protein [unclassified Haloferax]MBC9987080.1 hypothetical protein [Haloferax sp. AS1]